MNVVIIAGGKGTRMEGDIPKALVKVKGKTILDYQLDYFSGRKIVLALGYKGEMVVDYVKGKDVICCLEDSPLGTAGALKQALKKCESDFVIALNCDDVTNIDLDKLEEIKENTICCAHPRLGFGLIGEKDGFAEFVEKPLLKEWVSCGWYVFNRKELLEILPDVGMLEYDVFPKIKLRMYKHEGTWDTFNSKKDIEEFEKGDKK